MILCIGKYSGFTLVELMIVVAIIGILSAVAIPGFQTYMHNAKTSEAKVNLDSVQKGALSFFQAEHYYDGGMETTTRIYPESDSVSGIGQEANDDNISYKSSPDTYKTVMKSAPWSQLQFVLTSPFYFYYMYDSNNVGEPSFQASASASLDEKCDAIFIIEGRSDGSASAVLDLSKDSTKCNIAVAP